MSSQHFGENQSLFENRTNPKDNSSSSPLEFAPNFSVPERTILTVISMVQLVSGTSLNSMALLILVTNSDLLLKVPANRILCSLMVNDFLSSTVFLPYHTYLFRQDYQTLTQIRVYRTAAAFTSTWSVLNCLAITGDRFLAILYPLRYNALIVFFKVRVLVILAIAITTVFTLALFCASYLGRNDLRLVLEYMAVFTLCLPAVLYWKIYRSAREQIKKITIGSRTYAEELRMSLKSAANSARVVVLLIASFVPLLSYGILIEESARPLAEKSRILTWAVSFCFWNSCADPLVYFIFSTKFRRIIRASLRRWNRRVREAMYSLLTC
jgi:hypothetical protein